MMKVTENILLKSLLTKLIGYVGLCWIMPLTLVSCLGEDVYEGEESYFAIGNVHVIQGKEYYFELDEGSKLYPADTTAVHDYPIVDNQRAFVYFTVLDEPLVGYEYNAVVKHIENILTKDIYSMRSSEEDSIGNDRIDVDDIWLTSDYINIVYKFYHSNNPEKKHMLNLVMKADDSSRFVSDDGYMHLEFRHNAYSDTPLQGGTGIVSFRLDSIRAQMADVKGLCVHVNTLYGGERDFVIEK